MTNGDGLRQSVTTVYGASTDQNDPDTVLRTPGQGLTTLPQGAAMSVKQLAKHLPLYGQQAIGTSLNSLSVAGHLRRVRSRLTTGTGTGAGAGKGKGGEVAPRPTSVSGRPRRRKPRPRSRPLRPPPPYRSNAPRPRRQPRTGPLTAISPGPPRTWRMQRPSQTRSAHRRPRLRHPYRRPPPLARPRQPSRPHPNPGRPTPTWRWHVWAVTTTASHSPQRTAPPSNPSPPPGWHAASPSTT